MTREDPQLKIRLAPDLKDRVEAVAKVHGRTMNAEVVARLQASFHWEKSLPFAVQQAVDDVMEETGCSAVEALTQLVLAGQTQGGKVLNIRVAPGTTAKDVHDAISAALELVPPDTSVVFAPEHKG